MSVLVPLVIYDLPNRDCYALASNGELLLNQDDAVSNIDALDGAPVAGKWFLKHFENLMRQAGETPNPGKVELPDSKQLNRVTEK